MFECDACEGTGARLAPSAEVFPHGWKIAECNACRGLGHVVEATPAQNGDSMTGTIGHLRNVADLVAALNIEAILAEARLASHESATDLALEVAAGVAALREVAALVEETTAALALVSDRFGALMLSAVRAERFDLADVLCNVDDNKASDADLALLRKALAEKTLTAEYDADIIDEALVKKVAQ